MSESLDGAGRTIDGVTFLIDDALGQGAWVVGDTEPRNHHREGQQVSAKNLAAVMDVRPGAEDGKLVVRFSPDLRGYVTDALEGVEGQRRTPPITDTSPGALNLVRGFDPLWNGTIRGVALRTNARLKTEEWVRNGDTLHDLTVFSLAEAIGADGPEVNNDPKDPPTIEVPEFFAPILTALAEAEGLNWEATGLLGMLNQIVDMHRAVDRPEVQERLAEARADALASEMGQLSEDPERRFGVAGITEVQAEVAKRAVDIFDDGELLIGLDPTDAERVINMESVGGVTFPKLVYRDDQDAHDARDHLAAAIDKARQFSDQLAQRFGEADSGGSLHYASHAIAVSDEVMGGAPSVSIDLSNRLRDLRLEGEVRIDGIEEGIPSQPFVGNSEGVAMELEPFNGSRVTLAVRGDLGSVHTEGKLYADRGIIGEEAPSVTVGGFNLLRHLVDSEDTSVVVQVVEVERSKPPASAEPEPKTEVEDIAGKIRVALAAAKLLEFPGQARLLHDQTNLVIRLEGALEFALELDAEVKRAEVKR